MTATSRWPRRLVPVTFGGSADNIWGELVSSTIGRRLVERDERPLVELISRLRPNRILEIGVAAGIGAERMIRAAHGWDMKYYGFDLFDGSCKGNDVFSVKRRLEGFGAEVSLFVGDSRETLLAMLPALPKMDLIHIDGGHDFETVKSDWENARRLMHPGTVVVFDDCDNDGVRRVVDAIKGHRIGFIWCPYRGRLRAVVSSSRVLGGKG